MTNCRYEYLDDKQFLRMFDLEDFKTQYIRISILDFKTERLLAHIEGVATGGTINLSGTSNMRRVMSCSFLVDPNGLSVQGYENTIHYGNITEIRNLISMNKKVRVEVGFDNTLSILGYYPKYDKIWIPVGTFVIKTPNVAKSNSGINISLTLNDKTALLNGDMGGTIPAATVFSENELYSADTSERKVEKILIKDIIKHLVIDFGGEDPNNIIIEDIPDTIVKVMKWTGDKDLYFYEEEKLYVTEKIKEKEPDQIFSYGQDVGYISEPFVYPGTLKCNAGESAATMLDKIKNTLGNFEWFYDIDGIFHFQKKKNYLNTSHAMTVKNLSEQGYLSVMNMSKSVYTFDANNKKLLTNISSNPQYQNIKNDFVVWGVTKTATGTDKPIRYHLVFDTKPKVDINKTRLGIIYTDCRGLQQVILLNENNCIWDKVGDDKSKYYLIKDENKYLIFYWDEENQVTRAFPEWELCYLKTGDWQTELYFLGLENPNKAFAKNYYAAELNAEWPKIYDIKRISLLTDDIIPTYVGGYREDVQESNYEYFLDFLEGTEGGSRSISQFNINNIGRRVKVESDNAANCIFLNDFPRYVIINADGDVNAEREEAEKNNQKWIQVSQEIFDKLVIGGNKVSAYDRVKELLYQHTSYNESISLTTIPIYYLEPNTRISIQDNDVNLNGDYIINTISLPLGIGTSTISCTKCLDKTI